ncbi:MAG: PPC domain-containing DNA-binding protein [Cyanobacteria bacterium P01_A01_bin.45]
MDLLTTPMQSKDSIQALAIRLRPGSDLRRELQELVKQEKISAGTIIGAVGSLSKVCLRFAGREEHTILPGRHEILSLSGMLGEDGIHLHMMVANSEGECKGGHLVDGCCVYTTLELAIALLPNIQFQRVLDQETGYKELFVASVSE